MCFEANDIVRTLTFYIGDAIRRADRCIKLYGFTPCNIIQRVK